MTEFLTLLIDGIVLGSVTGLLAVSFALIIGVTGRFHVAYITTFALGAYAAIYVYNTYSWSAGWSAVLGLAVATVVGVAIELLIYRPISVHTLSRGANPLIPTFIASLGLATLGQNLISIHFNTTPTAFNVLPEHRDLIGKVVFPSFDVDEVIVSWVLILGIYAYLQYTQRGQWIIAVRSNQELAATVGIKVGRIFLLVFAIGSLISGLLGIMYAEATFASPSMGFDQVFEGFLIVFLAGMASSPIRMGIVGLIIGVFTDVLQYWVNPALSSTFVFGILILYVAYRAIIARNPQLSLKGIMGRVRVQEA